MDTPENLIQERGGLHRVIRELLGLSALLADTGGAGLEATAGNLADALLDALDVELLYIRLPERAAARIIQVTRSRHRLEETQDQAVQAALAGLLHTDLAALRTGGCELIGAGSFKLIATPFALDGVLAAGSARHDFPTDQDYLLLELAANQSATIVQRLQADEQLREQQELLRVTLASIGDAVMATDAQGKVIYEELRLVTDYAPVLLAHCDREGRYRFVNKGYTERFGLSPQDVVGKRIQDVVGEKAYAAFGRYVQEALSGRPVEFEMEIPYERIGARFMHCVYAPTHDHLGQVEGLVAVISDVTQHKRAEAALRESEQRFTRFMQQLPGLAWIKDIRGRYVYANDAALKAFGTSQADLFGKTDDDVFPPSTAAQFKQNDLLALSSGSGVQVIEQLADENGDIRYSLVSKFPLLDLDGRVALIGGMAIEITEQRRMEQALRRSEERFRSLMEQAPLSIQVLSPDGRTIGVNRAWEELWGVSLNQLADFNILSDPQLKAKGVLPYLQRAFAGEATEFPTIEYDVNATMPNRTRYDDARRWISAVAYPLKDDSGAVREVVLIHQDITARKRAEEERLRFAFLVENSRDFIGMCDADFNTFFVNRGGLRLVGLSDQDQSLQIPVLDFFFPEDHPFLTEKFFPQVLRDGFGEVDIRFRHFKTGQAIWFTYSVIAMQDAAGRPSGFATISRDISRLKQANEALQQADRRKDEFLATLAHELRNPLAPIRNSLQILKLPRVDAEMAQQTREMMERQVHHLVRLVDDLLDVSRVMRGKIELRREPVELASVVARAVETAKPLIEVQNHTLDLCLTPVSLLLDADPVRLAQVIGNLLTNAAKYTEANGHIWLNARREGDHAVLSVRDNGIGISADTLPHVFDLFVQVDHSSTKAQGGLGIGLTLVKNLVEMHGGSVQVHSEGLGKGSEFVIRLPLMEPGQQEQANEQEGKQQPLPRCPSGHRLMVVDDNRDAALSLAMLLRLQGHEVQVAHDGMTAVELAKDYRPSLIFLDIGMPIMDGFEVASRVRRIPGLDKTVLVALTGWGQQEDRRRTAEAGFHHHLVKPPEPKALQKLIAELNSRGEL